MCEREQCIAMNVPLFSPTVSRYSFYDRIQFNVRHPLCVWMTKRKWDDWNNSRCCLNVNSIDFFLGAFSFIDDDGQVGDNLGFVISSAPIAVSFWYISFGILTHTLLSSFLISVNAVHTNHLGLPYGSTPRPITRGKEIAVQNIFYQKHWIDCIVDAWVWKRFSKNRWHSLLPYKTIIVDKNDICVLYCFKKTFLAKFVFFLFICWNVFYMFIVSCLVISILIELSVVFFIFPWFHSETFTDSVQWLAYWVFGSSEEKSGHVGTRTSKCTSWQFFSENYEKCLHFFI